MRGKGRGKKVKRGRGKKKKNNDASGLDILGHFGTYWDNLKDFATSLEHLDCFPGHFRPFSSIIGSLKKKRVPDGRTDPLIEMRGRI